jgi:hypothetical protein
MVTILRNAWPKLRIRGLGLMRPAALGTYSAHLSQPLVRVEVAPIGGDDLLVLDRAIRFGDRLVRGGRRADLDLDARPGLDATVRLLGRAVDHGLAACDDLMIRLGLGRAVGQGDCGSVRVVVARKWHNAAGEALGVDDFLNPAVVPQVDRLVSVIVVHGVRDPQERVGLGRAIVILGRQLLSDWESGLDGLVRAKAEGDVAGIALRDLGRREVDGPDKAACPPAEGATTLKTRSTESARRRVAGNGSPRWRGRCRPTAGRGQS